MIVASPTDQEGTAVPNLDQSDAERIADALLAEIAPGASAELPYSRPADDVSVCLPHDRSQLVAALDELLDRGVIHAAPTPAAVVVSRPLTARELAAAAAATLAEARATAAGSLDGDAPARALALVAVATEYRQLGATVNGAVNMQPEQEGTN